MNTKNDEISTITNSAPQSPDPTPNLNLNPNPTLTPPLLADDPDPQLLAHFQAENDSPPPSVPLRARRVEIRARTGSFLRKLTREQQDQLFLWLAEHSVPRVAHLIAQQPPHGFAMRVEQTTLRRIRAMITTMHTEDRYEDSALAADSLSEVIDQNRVDFAPVIRDLLQQKIFDLARNQSSSPSDLKEVIASFTKLQELEFKARRIALESIRNREASSKRHQVDLNIIPPVRPANDAPPVQFQVIPRCNPRQIESQKESPRQ